MLFLACVAGRQHTMCLVKRIFLKTGSAMPTPGTHFIRKNCAGVCTGMRAVGTGKLKPMPVSQAANGKKTGGA